MLYKEIHIGKFIKERVNELELSLERVCSFLKKDEEAVEKMFESKSLDTDLLLRCSKLLEYDFFRIYSSHLILYSPPSAVDKSKNPKSDKIPYFRKNIILRRLRISLSGRYSPAK